MYCFYISLVESSELNFFDDCRKMNLTISVSDPSIFQIIGTSGKFTNPFMPKGTNAYNKFYLVLIFIWFYLLN